MKSPILLSVPLLAAVLSAQNTSFVLPTPTVPVQNNNLPFAGGVIRYQQWYSAPEWVASAVDPHRVLQVDFLAGPSGLQTTTTLDVELTMAHGLSFGPTGLFDANLVSGSTVVFPRSTVTVNTGPPGSVVLSFPFTNIFVWNGTDAVVLDVKIYGNGQASQPFTYDFQSTTGAFGKITRLWTLGNANAINAFQGPQRGWGLFTTFTIRPGTSLPFGTGGCPGAGGVTPVGSVTRLAEPATVWTHQISQAASQRLAMWTIGNSRTQWNALALPLDLGPYIGAANCALLTNPVANLFTTTVGGGPGAGTGSVSLTIPAIQEVIGLSFYTQWFVADPLAPNGLLSASDGLWHIVAPIGG